MGKKAVKLTNILRTVYKGFTYAISAFGLILGVYFGAIVVYLWNEAFIDPIISTGGSFDVIFLAVMFAFLPELSVLFVIVLYLYYYFKLRNLRKLESLSSN